MTGQFGVSVGELLRVSSDLHEVSSAMKAVMSTLGAQLAGAGPAWGDFAPEFADGPDGYLAQLDWVGGSVDAKTALLDYYSDLLKQAADAFQQSDNGGASSPSADNGTQTPSGAYGPFNAGGTTSGAPAGANPGIGSANVPAGATGLATTGTTNGVGPRTEEVTASPITPTDPSAVPSTGPNAATGGRGSGASPGDGVPEMPPPSGRTPSTPSQGDAEGEGPESGAATPGAAGEPAGADLPGDGGTAGVGADDDSSGRLGTGAQDGVLDSSMPSPDAEPFTGGTTPMLPTLPRLPNPPNPQKPRRADESEPPSPAEDGHSGQPPAAAKADPGPQRTGPGRVADKRAVGTNVDRPAQDVAGPPGRLPSVTRRAGVVGGSITRRDSVAPARRSGSDPVRGSGIAGDPLAAAADAIGLAVGHRDEDSGDGGGSHPGDGRRLVEDALTGLRADDDDLKRTER